MYIDKWYIILVIPAFLLGLLAQLRVKSAFANWSRHRTANGVTGAAAARYILDRNGLSNVAVTQVAGELTDHYDPRDCTVHLSQSVYGSDSVAAVGVAAHEVGHAIQHDTGYAPLQLRSAIIPVTNFGSKVSPILLILGFALGLPALVKAGILLFSFVALFQLITLPVEFNASRRALSTLEEMGLVEGEDLSGARSVLSAAALTYVAALVSTLAQLLRLILIYNNSSRRRR